MRDTPTVYDVAKVAGVSTATVSRVLSSRERVLPHTRERVLTAVAELGYVPSGAAKDLAARRTGVLGLCFPDLVGDQDIADGDAMYWYDEVIRGMERAARRSGYAVLIAASHSSDDVNLVLSVAGRCDGLVVLARTVPARMLEHIAMRIPVVLLAAERERGETRGVLDHLWVANDTGAYAVTSHLADHHGYTRIAFAAGPDDSPDSSCRFDGFRKALTERGLDAAGQPVYHGDFTTAGGRRIGAGLVAAGQWPQALVCANDQTAIGAMAALQSAGLQIPGDIAITGFDGIQLGGHLRPSLTTVAQPMRSLGETAVRLLGERMSDAALAPRAIELPVRLELRASCGCPELAPKTLLGAGNSGAAIDSPRPASEGGQPMSIRTRLYLNLKKAPYSSVAFRQGLSAGLDRASIAQKAEDGYVQPTSQSGLLLPGLAKWLDPSLANHGMVPYQPQQASALFTRAGYHMAGGKLTGPGGKRVTMTIITPNGFTDWLQGAQVIGQQLSKLGISASIQTPQYAAYYSDLQTGHFDAAIGAFGGSGSPYLDLNALLSSSAAAPVGQPAASNFELYSSPAADRVLTALQATTIPARQRQDTYALEHIMATQVPVIALFYGATWGEYSTKRFTGWPDASHPYAPPAPYGSPPPDRSTPLMIITHLTKA